MNRRKALGMSAAGFAAGVLAACGGGAAADNGSTAKPTIVMVHGAWHWGGCFLKVANLLAGLGYPVLLPDLKSHGYSDATYDQVVDMADYTASVSSILQAAPSPVILLGHSLGGAALTYLGELYSSKIRKLIYLTAFMTPNGKSANDYIFSASYSADPAAASLFQLLSGTPDGKGVALDVTKPALIKDAFYGDCSAHDVAIAAANIIPINSAVPGSQVSVTTVKNFGSIPRVFIECLNDHAIPIAQQRRMQADVPGASVLTLSTSHSSFFSQPQQLANMVVQAIGN
jgi:pimeloyl-ACP methyl ester carboxylesterase